MKKFLVLYLSSVPASEQMKSATPEQAKAGMALWMTWAQKARGAIVDLGSPVGNPTEVTAQGPGTSDAKIGGFSVLQAESSQALAKILEGHPHFVAPRASIEVTGYLPMPGM